MRMFSLQNQQDVALIGHLVQSKTDKNNVAVY